MLQPENIARMKQLGLSPSFLIGHIRYWGKVFRDDLLGPERVRAYDPCASALKDGLRIHISKPRAIAIGSDLLVMLRYLAVVSIFV